MELINSQMKILYLERKILSYLNLMDHLTSCDTVDGLTLDIDYDDNDPGTSNCKPEVLIEGGGGVGVSASPIIGNDGSLMHIRVVHGGFGYKLPPQVRIFDNCKLGSGVRAFLVLGSTGKIVETYDDIEDVEEYNFNNRRPLSLIYLMLPGAANIFTY